ncbi:MAG: hypothetical protein AAB554_01545 [Patescibacteria group bacterium]
MLRIFLHVLVLPALLWFDRRYGTHLKPSRAAIVWYLLGIPLAAVEAAASFGHDRAAIFLQDAAVALFYLPPAYFAFRYARKSGGIGKPFALYLFLAFISSLVAGLVMARAPMVGGFFGAS